MTVKFVNQHAKYLGKKSFSSQLSLSKHTNTHTDCSIWTTNNN